MSITLWKASKLMSCNIKEQNNKNTQQQQQTPEERRTIQTMVMGSNIFHITQEMLHIDHGKIQNKLKDIEQLDLSLSKIPTKALYKLQMSLAQEV
jgi:hypothetical protein